MNRRELLLLGGAIIASRTLSAQQKVMRVIGFLGGAIPPADAPGTGIAALERGLNETGYVDGENLRIEYRASAEDLVKDKVEVIIVANGGRCGKRATPPRRSRSSSS